MNQEKLRENLNTIIASGLTAKAIAKNTGISTDNLSRFKNGHICLVAEDAKRLEEYLNMVVIPHCY